VSDEVLVERHERIMIITLNRPEAMNAINTGLAAGLLAAVQELDEDDSLSLGVLTGNGRGFCSGMDLKEYAKVGVPRGLMPFVKRGNAKPMIAAVEGFALAGGLELALTCDLIVAAEGAKLGIPESKVGLIAAAGGLMRLLRQLPYGVAMQMALSGDPITAEQAHGYGMVTEVSPPGQALRTARELAERLARNAPLSLAASKQVLRNSMGLTESEFWEMQASAIKPVFESDDAREGPRAFAEKRQPQWRGR
jgi:enoyl-CoA hydratase